MSPSDTMLACSGLRAGYAGSQVLFGIDLQIKRGQVVTLLGRNGMGKSTTIKTIVGALGLQSGQIDFDGQRIDRFKADAIARLGIAIVPEGRQCFPNLSVQEHLTGFADVRNDGGQEWTLERIYQLFPRLKERSRNMGNELSGGEQQMLAIGRALSTNPKLLILDEATEGLAPLIRKEIWNCLRVLRDAGQTILVIDKYVRRLMELADRHFILERGHVVWQGTSPELAADEKVWSTYLGV